MESIGRQSLLSQTISSLRFPMSVMVVFIHANAVIQCLPVGSSFPFYAKDHLFFRYIFELVSNIIARVAVPTFFIISGFLFFYGFQFSVNAYLKKLKSRFHSLFIPYFSWNLLIIVFYFGLQYFTNGVLFGNNKALIDYTVNDFLALFWSSNDFWSYPIDWPLWFIRNLMVLVVLSPIFFLVAKYLRYWLVLILLVIWILGGSFSNCFIDFDSILFFYIGACLGLNQVDFVSKVKKYQGVLLALYLLSVLAIFVFRVEGVVLRFSILVGITLFVSLFANLLDSGRICSDSPFSVFLDSGSFFVFAFHAFPLVMSIKVAIAYMRPNTSLDFILIYFGCVFIVIALALCLFRLVKNVPIAKRILIGGR